MKKNRVLQVFVTGLNQKPVTKSGALLLQLVTGVTGLDWKSMPKTYSTAGSGGFLRRETRILDQKFTLLEGGTVFTCNTCNTRNNPDFTGVTGVTGFKKDRYVYKRKYIFEFPIFRNTAILLGQIIYVIGLWR